jgi:hypothetical protein
VGSPAYSSVLILITYLHSAQNSWQSLGNHGKLWKVTAPFGDRSFGGKRGKSSEK